MCNLRSTKLGLATIAVAALLSGGLARAQSAVPESVMDTFLGIPQGSLTGLDNGPVMNGSAIMQSITVSAGTTLSFDYDFLTNVPPPGSSGGLLNALDPFAFLLTGSTLTDIADNYSTYPAPMEAAPAGTGFLYQSGYQTYSTTFMDAGTYTLAAGVVDVTDDTLSSGLLLDNFQLSSGSVPNGSFGITGVVNSSYPIAPTNGASEALLSTGVPEPSSMVLLIVGGIGMTVGYRRRQRRLSLPRGR